MSGTGPHGPWPPEVPMPGPATPPPVAPPPIPMVYEEVARTDDLTERLLDRRIVMISGPLDLARATDAAARVMLLDGTGDDPIEVVMSCPDGDLVAATALADTFELVGVELRVICTGSLGGPALLPFAVATRRLTQPHATFRMREPRIEREGNALDLVREAEHQAAVLAELHRRLAAATGHDVDDIAEDMRRGRLLTTTDARAYGLVDEIVHRRGLRTV